MSEDDAPATPADIARTLREAADRLMSDWTAALTSPGGAGTRAAGGSRPEESPDDLDDPGPTATEPGSPRRSRAAGGTPGATAVPDLSALLGSVVPPATVSARQLQAVLDDIAARRAQVQALRGQLGLFDEQLAALEASLGPVLEWTRAWAGAEQAMTNLWRPPGP